MQQQRIFYMNCYQSSVNWKNLRISDVPDDIASVFSMHFINVAKHHQEFGYQLEGSHLEQV